MQEYYIWFIIIAVVIIVVMMYAYSWLSVYYPAPARPDGDFTAMINNYQSYPRELWFRNNPELFDKYLLCSKYRYVVFESDGTLVYDNAYREGWKHPQPSLVKHITRSVEYIRAASLTQGVVVRGKHNCLCELAKIGDRYRLVHVSEYIYSSCDRDY